MGLRLPPGRPLLRRVLLAQVLGPPRSQDPLGPHRPPAAPAAPAPKPRGDGG